MNPILTQTDTDLRVLLDKTQHRIDLCRDAIKMLTGYTPDNFKFTFSIQGKQVIQFDIEESDADMCMSYFAFWIQYYGRRMQAIKTALSAAG